MIVTKCSGWGDCYGIPVCCRTAVVLTCTRYNNIIISITFLYRIQRWSLSATQTNYTPPFLTHLVSHKSLRKQHNIIIQAYLPRFPRLRHCAAVTKNTYYNCTRQVVISINNRICIRLCCTRFLFAPSRPIALHMSKVCIPYVCTASTINARQQK